MAKSKPSSNRKPLKLSHGRPPVLHSTQKLPHNPSSLATRTTIRTHHTLQKSLALALSDNNTSLAASLRTEIEKRGGLPTYQAASLKGQSAQRGGDTSKTLLAFLDTVGGAWKPSVSVVRNDGDEVEATAKWQMLDVGALSAATAASRSKAFAITRIDLHSQGADILEQDFMQRPLPTTPADKFDIVCLSLVLNYVPDAPGRGEMLKRVCEFLVPPSDARQASKSEDGVEKALPFPALFLVLPAPCVQNSRYVHQAHLTAIITSLGFSLLCSKASAKLVYYLWRWHGPPNKKITFGKKEIVAGTKRNNFAIVVT